MMLLTDAQWQMILLCLRIRSNVYVGQARQCLRFLSVLYGWLAPAPSGGYPRTMMTGIPSIKRLARRCTRRGDVRSKGFGRMGQRLGMLWGPIRGYESVSPVHNVTCVAAAGCFQTAANRSRGSCHCRTPTQWHACPVEGDWGPIRSAPNHPAGMVWP